MANRLGVAALLLASASMAMFHNNLAYQSPSRRHESLAVPVEHVIHRQTGHLYVAAELNFTHGVASGDPYSDSVILWTRLAPCIENTASEIVSEGVVPVYNDAEAEPPSRRAACVEYSIATDRKLKNVVGRGIAHTSSDVDYTVKFEAQGLQPFTTYYYQFNVCGSDLVSPVGRTKTIPNKNDRVERNIRLAVYSCSNYPRGFFNAYGGPVRKDSVDYVVHLGDYIYEGQSHSRIGRDPLPDRELFTLYDYRRRIAQYRTDVDLHNSHRRFAWIPVWDDHEFGDNAWRNGSSDSDGEVFAKRKQAAVRAYFEWMPLRQVEMDDNLRIWRSFSMGTLLDLVMLDTRLYDRDITALPGAGPIDNNFAEIDKIADQKNRTMLGFRQEKWFYDKLSQSSERGAAWRVVGNQVVFSSMIRDYLWSEPVDRDQWDGYLANRDRVFQHLKDNKINNTIMLSGDSHASWVSDLVWLDESPYNSTTGEGAFGVEFGGTAISSYGVIGKASNRFANEHSRWLVANNKELQWQDLFYRGYFELSIGYESLTSTFFGIPDLKTRNSEEIVLARFLVKNGENKLARNPLVGGGVVRSGALKNGLGR